MLALGYILGRKRATALGEQPSVFGDAETSKRRNPN
jgi:hypothetical protein